jgi:hypothetical protein
MNELYNGMPVIFNKYMTIKEKCKRHKKKRINKKLIKKFGEKERNIPDKNFYVMDEPVLNYFGKLENSGRKKIIIHPTTFKKLKNILK